MCRLRLHRYLQAMLFIAYIEVIAQFVLSRSFKQHFANASLAQWAGPTRPLVRLPALFIFFRIFLQHNY